THHRRGSDQLIGAVQNVGSKVTTPKMVRSWPISVASDHEQPDPPPIHRPLRQQLLHPLPLAPAAPPTPVAVQTHLRPICSMQNQTPPAPDRSSGSRREQTSRCPPPLHLQRPIQHGPPSSIGSRSDGQQCLTPTTHVTPTSNMPSIAGIAPFQPTIIMWVSQPSTHNHHHECQQTTCEVQPKRHQLGKFGQMHPPFANKITAICTYKLSIQQAQWGR
ncbi:hypothetical protein ACLOJK_022865, partial [Asimina triloba]